MLTILCIDDDRAVLTLRAQVLHSCGFEVITATDGFTGIALTREHEVDSVVLDYSMPGMNGEEVARVLKREHPDLPIILCSGCADIPETVFSVVDVLITKGDGVQFLISSLRAVHARKQARRQNNDHRTYRPSVGALMSQERRSQVGFAKNSACDRQ